MVQEYDPAGNVVWEYIYSTSNHVSHHDLCVLPNGNVILTAWEVKSTAELTQAGKSNATSSKWPTHFIELQPNGTSATIVWEWHIWDHLIQDHDATKDNFGVVSSHPELMDINAVSGGGGGGPGGGGGGGDWFHVNGIEYNESLDQLVFTSRYASELFIIDHSTTTAEAAGHTGGLAGKGGDFLYRWGNPGNYGSTSPQTITAACHDPRWIKDDGRPNGGYIQFMNNSGGSGGSSVVDAIDPPVSGYNYTLTGTSYAPTSHDWRHNCIVSNSGQGASDRMSNGNVFVNVSQNYMYEVDQNGATVWQHSAAAPKAFRYECDNPGIIALLGTDPCGIASLSEKTINNIGLYPNPSTGHFKIDGFELGQTNLEISVFDVYGKIVHQASNSLEFDLAHCVNGVYIVQMNFDGEKSTTRKVSLFR